MYRPKKDPTTQPIRMAPLETLPTVAQLMSALSQAQDSHGRIVELVWPKPDSQTNYLLSVGYKPESSDPVWIFNEGAGRQNREIWTYGSGDLTLIFNLINAECTGEVSAVTDNNGQGSGANKFASNTSSTYSTSLLGLQATSGTRYPVVNASKSMRDATMEGDLTDMAVPNLLQSVVMSKMTGRLFVDTTQAAAELFFEDGNLIHATAVDVDGDLALMELVTWERGKFYFYRDETTTLRTVKRRLDAILMEGITLLDQSKALIDSGLTMESYLDKAQVGLTEPEFDQAVAKGAPVDLKMQKEFYLQLDGCSTLFDLLRKKPMVKKDWVGVLFNLVNCGLIVIAKKPTKVDKTAFLESTNIDSNAIQRVNGLLARPDTGIMSYPSFHFFLDQEFKRYQLFGTPFAIVIFEMRMILPNRLEPLSAPALAEAFSRIRAVKRSLDVLAHFETLSYILLLPNTEAPSAAMLAHRLLETMRSSPIMPGVDNLALAFGIAGVPEDCHDMGLLLSAAKASKMVAQRNNYPIVMFKDMQAPPA